MSTFMRLVRAAYHQPCVKRAFHTSVGELQDQLRDCQTVLDLGCGPSSPIIHCPWLTTTVGVEAFGPYVEAARRAQTHTLVIQDDFVLREWPAHSFDAVLLIGVLEHLSREDGDALLTKAKTWASKRVVVSVPNGFLPQGACDQNPFQIHRSGWTVDDFTRRGFRVRGMAGFRLLRRENENEALGTEDELYATVRLQPRWLGLLLAALSQTVAYWTPRYAFELYASHPPHPPHPPHALHG